MKVALYINNYGTTKIVLPDLRVGNPGIGGSQYEMFLLAQLHAEKESRPTDHDFVLFTSRPQPADFTLSPIVMESVEDVFTYCVSNKVDFLILRANDGIKLLNTLSTTKVIYWAHNFINYEAATIIAKSNVVKRVVFVSHEEYDYYYDHDIIYKSTFIFNAIPDFKICNFPAIDKRNNVVFIGDISPYKMLHKLTRMWPSIIRKCPDAKLIVIGNGNLYGKGEKFGSFQIASEEYEKILFNPLVKNKVLDSTHFLGLVRENKLAILSQAKIGVLINPMETFCIAATDIITSGVPVVAPKSTGYCDVIDDTKTGFLCKSLGSMRRTIIRLLKAKKSLPISSQSLEYLGQFSVDTFWNNWKNLLCELSHGKPTTLPKHKKNLDVNHKWLGIFLHNVRRFIHLPNSFSRLGIKTTLSRLLRRH